MLYHSKAKLERKKKARITARYDLSLRPTPEEKTRRLLRTDPTWWPILRECLVVAGQRNGNKRTGQDAGKFAGTWVIQGLRASGITLPNNLRTLSSIGLLKIVTTTRSGNRAYYTIPDSKNIARTLNSLGY